MPDQPALRARLTHAGTTDPHASRTTPSAQLPVAASAGLRLGFGYRSATLIPTEQQRLDHWLKTNDTVEAHYVAVIHISPGESSFRDLIEARGDAVVAAIHQTLPSRSVRIVALNDPASRHVVVTTEFAFNVVHPNPNPTAPLAPPPKPGSPSPGDEAP